MIERKNSTPLGQCSATKKCLCCDYNINFFLSLKVAGGIASGETIKEAVIKECEEEANLPEHWFDRMKPAGCVR